MRKRVLSVLLTLCMVLCLVLFAGCAQQQLSTAERTEVRNSGTAIQWKYSDESDWHDLVTIAELTGAAGENGADGIDGNDGINGTNGVNGKDGKNGTNGVNGKDGASGKDGNTPFIGENGNWWIGGTDTGVKAAGEKGEKGDTGANGKDGSCVGYFSAHGETNSWGKLPLVVKKESGGLISYNSSNNTITLSKGHTYSLVFSGTVAVSANGDDRTCVVALADGYSNDIGLDTQISTIIPKNGQTARLTVAYNTIYTAEENIVLTFQYINMMSMYTNFGGSRYNITIIALN